ncbi:DNA methyltransferase [Bifidobacterium catulorum]|uniref:site-specific DNA-methyltransferase (adenine-specific) n=1 Tax=Bifidobacterium catulorum TaxID=1630173 RepID=A0A2U2MS80_9BIFI|nr:DNA methyltransferase [Bifidobacterium catulorum]PWG59684.1 class I SAM-dependent DNA methyltransferase [Bifidobacterium catulorum]
MDSLVEKQLAGFVENWSQEGRGHEKQEAQSFWRELLSTVFGWSPAEARDRLEFEHPVNGGFIDVFCPDARLLVEQKSRDVSLDRKEPRRSENVTPLEQALRYANDLPASQKPRFLCTSNFRVFRFYDLDEDAVASKPFIEFPLADLIRHTDVLTQIFSRENSRIYLQEQVSRKAGLLVADLHNALCQGYEGGTDSPEMRHDLAILTVRLVFLMYAEDAGLFSGVDMFSRWLEQTDTRHLRRDLKTLLVTLETPKEQRDPDLESEFAQFPYVDGGLFAESIRLPRFTDETREQLIAAARGFDWSSVSPVVFGSLMEETLSHDQRRQGGMHYTTVRNIHRVIDPLFLDRLNEELDDLMRQEKARIEQERKERKARYNADYTKFRKRGKRLDETDPFHRFRERLGNLNFLDPACGSGNFLTESYLRLRELENKALEAELGGQGTLLSDDELVKVHIDQFHGIEINDFACAVARTALWIAEQQALADTLKIAGYAPDRLPLHDSGNIVQANALQTDWNTVLPGERCDYVMGNPPFLGHISKSPEQTNDLRTVWGRDYDGYLDYATGWYRKASQYLTKPTSAFALVSTNSITQGQPVPALFKPIIADGWRIAFAHRTFAWDAQSTDNANVHVVIIGMDRNDDDTPPVLFTYDDINGDPKTTYPQHINGYLLDAPDIYVQKRSQKLGPLSPMLPRVSFGSLSLDGGNLTIDTREAYDEAISDPIAAKYVRKYRNGRELINDKERWCLWLVDAPSSDILQSPFLRKRVEAVKAMRLATKRRKTVECAATPQLFGEIHQPSEDYLAIPVVFSSQRDYATCTILPKCVIAGQKLHTGADPDGFAFAIAESKMFITWQKAVGGRLKSDCQFSNTVVWNNIPLPAIPEETRSRIAKAGQDILKARANHPGESLAKLYSPLMMHPDIINAHKALDRIVDVAFGADRPCKNDDERLRILFRNYAKLVQEP